MEHVELVLLFLLVAVAALTWLSSALDVPYPILLVLGGSVLGFVPGVPEVELNPDLVLLIVLPPLLFHAAYFASLRELRANARAISLNACALVLLTMSAVAVVTHAVVPGMPWVAAFAFGAIVSPTDPLAAVTIARRLGVPHRLIVLIEGESLINDGTALVAYRTALAAAVGGSFSLLDAAGDFVLNVVGGVVVGVIVAQVLLWVFRRIVGDDLLGVTVSLIAGFAAYVPAEELGVSGVIAAVTVGLLVGHRAAEHSTASSRLRSFAFWDVLVFLLNALLFVLVGLQLPSVLEDQDRSAATLIGLGALAGAVVIGVRLLWSHTIPYLIRALDRRPRQVAMRVAWRERMVLAWGGLRGAVSLAAALALPRDFPERDLIIWLTLCVILATLVLQGVTLPALIRTLGIREDESAALDELRARKAAARAALHRIDTLRKEDWTRPDSLDRLHAMYEFRYNRLAQRAGALEADENLDERSATYQRTVRDLLDTQRRELVRLRDDGQVSDEILHALTREIDLEDQRLEI
ncbi:sodium/proton antiporter (CPA1 family) [Solirubrobacter pauli]|uniref:Sodium/proton antiporter (CPA1 family) n=1 Tax=Solirubrobacter pauli TaxID=166793 RepID=A0A660LEJ9_9ACTN|nr:Na+/H+ antiporter [Solirubrobacter pauli]RKQ92999.1 sodium/proton antiporter (CPA1 family) [Solirubrobacter pauli]